MSAQKPLIGASYVNKKGKTIDVRVSGHAVKRFFQRAPVVLNRKVSRDEIVPLFNKSTQITKYGRKMRKRNKKYNNNSLYFASPTGIKFVVEDGTIVTVTGGDVK